MKKLFFMFIAMVAMTFAACGNKTANVSAQNDSDSVAVADTIDSVTTDSASVDSVEK